MLAHILWSKHVFYCNYRWNTFDMWRGIEESTTNNNNENALLVSAQIAKAAKH